MTTRLALLRRGARRERLEALLTGKRRRNISKASRGDGPAHAIALGTARRYPRQADARILVEACNRRRTHHLRNDFQIRSMNSSTTGKSAALSLFMVNSTWILETEDSGISPNGSKAVRRAYHGELLFLQPLVPDENETLQKLPRARLVDGLQQADEKGAVFDRLGLPSFFDARCPSRLLTSGGTIAGIVQRQSEAGSLDSAIGFATGSEVGAGD
jgi:hypothetical protein